MKHYRSIEEVEDFEEFFCKIKIISELFMRLIEIENMDETVIFLSESMALCVQGYEEKAKNRHSV